MYTKIQNFYHKLKLRPFKSMENLSSLGTKEKFGICLESSSRTIQIYAEFWQIMDLKDTHLERIFHYQDI